MTVWECVQGDWPFAVQTICQRGHPSQAVCPRVTPSHRAFYAERARYQVAVVYEGIHTLRVLRVPPRPCRGPHIVPGVHEVQMAE